VALRIAIVHSFYRSTVSGENEAVLAHVAALGRAGHEVRLFAGGGDAGEEEPLQAVRAGLRVASGRGRSPLASLRAFAPDVVSVHNLFPNFASKWLRKTDAFVAVTLHNYRPLCANAVLFREGGPCTRCLGGNPWWSVRFGCYRSPLASVPLAWANRGGVGDNDLLARADRVIAVSETQRAIYVEAGLSPEKTEVIPNFVPDNLDPGRGDGRGRQGWLAVGRLSPEKGFLEILADWPDDVSITVIGDGPLRDLVRQACGAPGRRFLGPLPRREVVRRMGTHIGLVVPSRWFEACPLVYVEALAAGLPVLAWDPCSVASMVRRDGTGVGLHATEPCAATVASASPWQELAGEPVRRVFEGRYTEKAFVERFLAAVK
jgi:glycosyltransferase involved in cell wall biosynthesis